MNIEEYKYIKEVVENYPLPLAQEFISNWWRRKCKYPRGDCTCRVIKEPDYRSPHPGKHLPFYPKKVGGKS